MTRCCVKCKLYRLCIEEVEKNVDLLEQKLDKVSYNIMSYLNRYLYIINLTFALSENDYP